MIITETVTQGGNVLFQCRKIKMFCIWVFLLVRFCKLLCVDTRLHIQSYSWAVILMIPEANIDESFPKGNFLIEGFSTPYRLDR